MCEVCYHIIPLGEVGYFKSLNVTIILTHIFHGCLHKVLCMCVCLCVMIIHMHTYTHTNTHIHTNMQIHTYKWFSCLSVSVCVCMCIYVQKLSIPLGICKEAKPVEQTIYSRMIFLCSSHTCTF